MSELIKEYITKIESDVVCVHPTDTILGLSFNPFSQKAKNSLCIIKNRKQLTNFVSLVGSLAIAKRFWQPLPVNWNNFIQEHWPNTLSIIWKASTLCPDILINSDNKSCFRFPQLEPSNEWYSSVLHGMQIPLPTTSINFHTSQPIREKTEVQKFILSTKECVYLSPLIIEPTNCNKNVSTIIEILDDSKYKLLRAGEFCTTIIDKKFKRVENV